MRKVFLDVGASTGTATMAFLGLRKHGTLSQTFGRPRSDARSYEFHLFEPSLGSMAKLEIMKLALEKVVPKIYLFNVVVMDYDGEVDFYCDESTKQTHTVVGTATSKATLPVVKKLAFDLAGWMLETFKPEDYIVLKIDIEGAEYAVVQRLIDSGAISLVQELYVEWHRVAVMRSKKDKLAEILDGLAFKRAIY